MTFGTMDLSHLTDDEKKKILDVIQRDDQLREAEKKRVSGLKDEIKTLRLRGTIREGRNAMRSCARCREPFGLFFNTGGICPKCQHRVCHKCRESLVTGKWICVFCFRQMEFEAKSGNWFFSRFPRTMRDHTTNEIVPGAAIVRDAISSDAGNSSKSAKKLSSIALLSSKPTQPPVTVEPIVRPVDLNLTALSQPQPGYSPVSSTQRHAATESIPRVEGTTARSTPPIPAITISPDNSRTLPRASDSSSLKHWDEYDADVKTDSPSNLSRLSTMTGSTESVLSYYSCAGEGNYGKIPVTGEIQFSVRYDIKNSNLEITIRQCRDLAAAHAKKNRSDPYVKCYLLPDKSRTGKRKTHCKKNTLNPIFDEVLKYSVKRNEIETRTLCVMVWNNDKFGRNDFLGEVNLPLTYDILEDSSLKWYKLSSRVGSPLSVLAYKGDLEVSLKFDNARRLGGKIVSIAEKGVLQVLVKQARNLTALRSSGSSDPFCQAFLLPHRSKHDKQKSSIIKNTCNPTWNHTFVFEDLTENDLRETSVELAIWDYDLLTSHEFLGGIRLNLGSGTSRGKAVDWMDAKGDEMSLWQAMLDRPNTWIDGTLLLRVHMTPRK